MTPAVMGRTAMTAATELTNEQLHMVKHAWGFDSSEPGFRTHYCTNVDNPDMKVLVDGGWFQGPTGIGNFGEGHGMYHVTDQAEEYLRSIAPKKRRRRRS